MNETSHNDNTMLPVELCEAAKEAMQNLLPQKSKAHYEETYTKFLTWRKAFGTNSSSETVLKAYFNDLSKSYKPSSLWSFYSMIKSTLNVKEGIDISKYSLLNAFLRSKSSGFVSKKSKVQTNEEVNKFLSDAPDYIYLAMKVALIFGISGACRGNELVHIKVEDISKHGDLLAVNLPDTKTKTPRQFVIDKVFTETVNKYWNLRPSKTTTNRFFLKYEKGKCTVQPIGKNKFQGMPKEIAKYLNLKEPESYTGHAFRRTAATMIADSGADIVTIKRLGGWKSSSVAEGYIEESIQNKAKLSKIISSSVGFTSAKTIHTPPENTNETPKRQKLINGNEVSEINIDASTSKTINFSPKKGEMVFNNCTFVVHNFNAK